MASVAQFQISLMTSSLQQSNSFYTSIIGCTQMERGDRYIRYNFYNHVLTVYFIDEKHSPQEHCNHVDKHDVPVPHFGIVLTVDQFHQLSKRLTQSNIKFIIEPHLRFPGLVGEQWTMFFKDPTGNNLQFKAMSNPNYLFAS